MNEFATLVLSLPARDSTLRMRLWRRLKEAGCGVLRDGVYVLPLQAGEALARIAAEIRSHGGLAFTADMKMRDEAQAQRVRELFDRSADYGALVRRIHVARGSLARLGPRRAQTEVRRLGQALGRIAAIDFHPGEAKVQATAALGALQADFKAAFAGGEPRFSRKRVRRLQPERYRRRVWATRRNPWVDRLASAWLIKRFIDREARFAWITRPSERPKNAVGFDYDGAEFTHTGKRVTYEVLLASFALEDDAALAAIGSAVRFLDVGGIPVPDARGLETLLKGAREKAKSDDALLAEALRTFDLLYRAYRS